jgi:hypothetical protein
VLSSLVTLPTTAVAGCCRREKAFGAAKERTLSSSSSAFAVLAPLVSQNSNRKHSSHGKGGEEKLLGGECCDCNSNFNLFVCALSGGVAVLQLAGWYSSRTGSQQPVTRVIPSAVACMALILVATAAKVYIHAT